MNYKLIKLGEISSITKLAGFEFTNYVKYIDNGEIIALRGLNLRNGRLDLNDIKKISADVSNQLPRSKLFKHDIVLTYTGNSYGDAALILEDNKYHLAPNIAKITPNENIDPFFLFHVINSSYFRKQMGNYNSGSSQPTIPMESLRKLLIPLPDFDLQKKIGVFLNTIDDLISLNLDSNDIIMEYIETIFNYWFLQFNFPNELNKPYKSNGGKSEYNSKIDMEIPEGWGAGSLNDIAEYINGLACQKYRPVNETDKLPVVKITEMHDGITDKTEFVRSDIDEKHIINNGDILFSWSATLETMIWTGGKAGLNQHIFKVIPKDYGKYYVYMMLSMYIINFVRMAESRKTTMGHITQDHLLQSKIPLPPIELTYEFDRLVSPLFDKYIQNNIEITELNSLKEFLLPLLMNGQIVFKD